MTASEVAQAVGKAAKGFHLLRKTASHEWSHRPAFPTPLFLERPVGAFVKSVDGRIVPAPIENWMLFYEQERSRAPAYYDELAAVWKASPQAIGPVVVAFLPNGRLDIGDGWHRAALSLMLGMETIPAVVGIPRRS